MLVVPRSYEESHGSIGLRNAFRVHDAESSYFATVHTSSVLIQRIDLRRWEFGKIFLHSIHLQVCIHTTAYTEGTNTPGSVRRDLIVLPHVHQ